VVVCYNRGMSTNPNHPSTTYTLQPEMQDGRLVVYGVELDLLVKTDTTILDKALNQANDAIIAHLEEQQEATGRVS
jgi:hypothetical protein